MKIVGFSVLLVGWLFLFVGIWMHYGFAPAMIGCGSITVAFAVVSMPLWMSDQEW